MCSKRIKVPKHASVSSVKNTHANMRTSLRCCIGCGRLVPYKNWKQAPAYGTCSWGAH